MQSEGESAHRRQASEVHVRKYPIPHWTYCSVRLAPIAPGCPNPSRTNSSTTCTTSSSWDRPAPTPVRRVWSLSKSAEAKARLLPAMAPGNVEKTRTAPVTAIVAYDLEFHEKLPELESLHGHTVDIRRQAGPDPGDRVSQQQPAGSLPHHGGARAGTRLRSHVRVRCRQGQRASSFPTANGRRTSSAIWAMGIRRSSIPDYRGCRLMKPARCCRRFYKRKDKVGPRFVFSRHSWMRGQFMREMGSGRG